MNKQDQQLPKKNNKHVDQKEGQIHAIGQM